MADLVQTYAETVVSAQGVRYTVHAYGERNESGSWDGWLVFEPAAGTGSVLRTDRETNQPQRADLDYWASGLEPIYLDGALSRASSI